MTTGYTPLTGKVAEIEQAIARGETLDWICDTLEVEAREVDDVMRRMDAVVAQDDVAVELIARLEPRHVMGGRAPLAEHGTHAAFNRHRKRGQEPCDECWHGERAYQRNRDRAQRPRSVA